jgi:hypothetical protein
MKLRLFNLMTILLLLVCVVSAALWGSSYFCTIGWRFFSQDERHSWTTDVDTIRGGIQFRQDIRPPYSFIVSHGPGGRLKSQAAWARKDLLGFGMDAFNYPWTTNRNGPTSVARRIVLVAPWYPLFLLTALGALPGVVVFRRRRLLNGRQRRGLCLVCGYDVRETPERCPECGMVPAQKKEITSA